MAADMSGNKKKNSSSGSRVKRLKRFKCEDTVENKSQEFKKMKCEGSLRVVSQEDLTNVGLLGKINSRLNLQVNCIDVESSNESNSSADQPIDDDDDCILISDEKVKSQPPSPGRSSVLKCIKSSCDHELDVNNSPEVICVHDYREKISFKIPDKNEKFGRKVNVKDNSKMTSTYSVEFTQNINRKIRALKKTKKLSSSLECVKTKTTTLIGLQKSSNSSLMQSFNPSLTCSTPKATSTTQSSPWIRSIWDWTTDSTNASTLIYNSAWSIDNSTTLSQSCPNLFLSSNQDWEEYKNTKQIFSRNLFSNFPKYELEELLKDVDDGIKFIDTHCHLDFLFKRLEFKDSYAAYRKLNQSSFPSCYEGCIAIFCDPSTFDNKIKGRRWWDLMDEENVWGACGCHPHYASKFTDEVEAQLHTLIVDKKIVALGEIGLDYSNRNATDRTIQQQVFRRQIKIALKHEKPLIIHSRDAADDTLQILKEMVPSDYKIHRHCFTGDWIEAQIWLKKFPNLYLGFTPVVTFPTATEVHEVVKKINMQRILLETDAPYFLPRSEDKTRKWSHPGMAIHVAAQIAALRVDVNLEDVLKYARENTKKMYGI